MDWASVRRCTCYNNHFQSTAESKEEALDFGKISFTLALEAHLYTNFYHRINIEFEAKGVSGEAL